MSSTCRLGLSQLGLAWKMPSPTMISSWLERIQTKKVRNGKSCLRFITDTDSSTGSTISPGQLVDQRLANAQTVHVDFQVSDYPTTQELRAVLWENRVFHHGSALGGAPNTKE